ncbi:MAG TPA: hypothetical protein VGR18_10320 [Rubrobacter sp.]|nr:hypothetical protein [Rubrobacter sp.]
MTEGTRERRSRERAQRALEWTFTGLAAIVAAGVLWFFFATELDDTYLLFSGVAGLSFPVVGATVITRRPGHAIGWIFVAIGAGMSLVGFANGYAAYSLTVLPDPLPATGVVAWLSGWLWVPSFGLLMTFALLLFPDGHLPSARWRPVAYLAAGSIAVTMADFAVSSWLDPYASVYAPQTVGSPVVGVWFGLLSASGLASAASLVVRFRRSRGEERLQLKWVAYAAAVTVAIVVPAVAVTRGASPSPIIVVAAPLVPVAAGVAILRYRLYDIDVVINRTLVYGTLTVLLAVAYVGSVVGLQLVLRALTGQESTLAVVASTLAIAALFSPLRRRVQAFVDRRFFRKKYDAAKTLAAFNARLRDETELETLSADVVGVVRETMQPAHVSLWLRR